MIVTILAIIGFGAGVVELRKGHLGLGLFATLVCSTSLLVNFLI